MKTQETHSLAIVRFLLEHRGFSKDEVARMAGYSSRRMIDYVMSGHMRGLGSKAIDRLALSLDMAPGELLQKALSFQGPLYPNFDDFEFIAKMAARPRGGDGGHEADPEIVDWYCFKREFLETKGNPKTMRMFEVSGGSMAPTLNEGDMVLVDQSKAELIVGKIFVVTLDDALMVKRLGVEPGVIALKSDSGEKDILVPKELQSQLRIDGQVIWSCREY